MGSRELLAYILIGALLAAAFLLAWRIRRGQRRAEREDRKHVRIDLMRRADTQPDETLEGSR